MDSHCDCAEPPAAEQPSGKINKTAFKLFKRRKSGGTMPSIFGVRSKGGEGKGASKTGMVRSRTHDGLADAVLESGKKEEAGGGEAPGKDDAPSRAAGGIGGSGSSSVAKSHSFFSLLRKNGRPENGKAAENAEQRAGVRQKKGLKGIFSSMRWHRKDKNGKEERGEASEIPSGLIMPGSLTASLECIKEETPKPLSETPNGAGDAGLESQQEKRGGDAGGSAEEPELGGGESRDGKTPPGEDPAAAGRRLEELGGERPDPGAGEVGTAKDAAITGCGDIIADQEEDVGGGSGGCEKSTPGASKMGASKKHPTMVAYQGGGEEMASPDQVDDTYLQEFWDMLSQTEETETGGGGGGGTKTPEGLKDSRGTEGAQNRVVVKRGGLNQIPIHLNNKEEQKGREKEQHEGVPNSDEGYWDSTTPGPEEDSTTSIQKETLPRDSYSGDALYDLYAEPDENPPGPSEEEVTCMPRSKPVSPVTTTCSLKTPSSTVKDSKIPISIKHLASHPASHGTDTSNSHHVAHHHLAKSEMHRTKIPVSKVLVRRVSNRGLAGTTVKTATHQDSAKK
ncbi:APC membrane recruitment protein 2 [Coturnix japonica]|uniref:APC membrane recruitment protein 2 n=1 Tax=Coturnix japonica TaxID=93934 RepID=UPI000776E48C|nr:APC membrane recruitment protein 2 [Coturnix japonica]